MTPDLAIVKLLLAHGAQPTTAAIARVRAIHNAPVLAVLEARKAELESTSRADALAEKLIEAVEKRRLDLLRSALAAGADPNARKRITLTVSVPGFGTRSETVFGESALVLAVLYAQDALVQELLDAGANVHAEVEWRVPNWESEWTMALWNRTRWILHYRCDSLLDLALGSPVLASPFRNVEDDYTILGEARGKLALNKDGGHVHIRTPSSQSEAHDTGNFVPTVGVVRLLLDWGAQITAGAREAAISLRERTYALLVEEALAKSSARRLHGLSAPRRPDSGAAEKKRTFEARLVEETGKLTEFLEEEKFAKDLRAAQLASLQQQLQEAKGQRDTWRAAKAAEEAQTQPDPYQRYTNPNPNPYPNPNPNPNNDIQERLLALEREKAALLAQVGGATVNGPPPVSSVLDRTVDIPRPAQPLETMMVAMSDFYPRDSDELALRYGDGVFVSVGFADGWASVSLPGRPHCGNSINRSILRGTARASTQTPTSPASFPCRTL
ncbi:hypothetical protein M427DRAFT_389939 [Gonapodya prolifera JEL478]|uniref:Uncharacterized protein n=1 Tax=Gonapodya prolifera (strain JEL478) TaxID=1344416 RepID=A0A139A844_GONPJ|nr:hypothetical protein M427DRAFT_389939 [Gonapodya prolifera JEL478]|eukprot:KXS12869.1 hypothetical protein M427DRAFT_389939 [Gonapodya prolifera JEL478]